MEFFIFTIFNVSFDTLLFPFYAGPDKFVSTCLITKTNHQKVHPPTITARVGFKEYYVTYDNDGCRFVKNKFKAARKKGLNPFATRFTQAAYYLPNKSNLCSYAIITGKHDETIQMPYLRWKDPLFEGMFVIPKLHDSIKRKTCRRFFVVPREQYLSFKKEHKMGISTKNGETDPVQFFDSNVSTFVSNSHTMLHDVVVPHFFNSYVFIMTRLRE
jgi:hypothetical protein